MATRTDIDPWANEDRRDSQGPISIGSALLASKPLPKSTPTSNGQDMAARIDIIAGVAGRFPGANAGSATAEKDRIRYLVEDTITLPLDVLRVAMREGLKIWKFLPSAAEVYEAAQPELRHQRDMARINGILATPVPKALPAPPPRDIEQTDVESLNEWGRPLGMRWDASGKMTRSEPAGTGKQPLEQRTKHTATPQAVDYAELRERIAVAAPPVSDLSPAMRALRDRTTDTAGNVTQRVG